MKPREDIPARVSQIQRTASRLKAWAEELGDLVATEENPENTVDLKCDCCSTEKARSRIRSLKRRNHQHLVYFLAADDHAWVKIGKSRDILTLDNRIKSLAGGLPFSTALIGVSSVVTEVDAHSEFFNHHVRAEWFELTSHVMVGVHEWSDVFCADRDGAEWWDEVWLRAASQKDSESARIAQIEIDKFGR